MKMKLLAGCKILLKTMSLSSCREICLFRYASIFNENDLIVQLQSFLLQKIKDSQSIVVFFHPDGVATDSASVDAITEDPLLVTLEGADEVLDEMEIPLVKSSDRGLAEEFGIVEMPSIVVFQVQVLRITRVRWLH